MRSRHQKNRLRIVIIILIIALLAGLGAAFYFFVYPRLSFTARDPVEMPFAPEDPYIMFQSGVAYMKDGNLVFVDAQGAEEWRQSVPLEAKLAAGGDRLAVYTRDQMSVYSKSGVLAFTKAYAKEIDFVAVNSSLALVLIREADQSATMELLNSSGSPVDNLAFTGQSALGAGFFGDSMAYVLTMKLGSASVDVRLTTYNSAKNTISTVVTASGQIAYAAKFSDKDFYLVGTNHLTCYNYGSDIKAKLVIYGWRMLDSEPTGMPMLMTPVTDSGQIGQVLRVYAAIDQSAVDIGLPPGTLCAFVRDKSVYAVTSTEVTCYNLTGKRRFTYPLSLGIEVDGITVSEDKNWLMLESGDRLFLIQTPK